MTRKQVEKYVGKLVAVRFRQSWVNDALDIWVFADEEYIGELVHCECEGQEHLYCLNDRNGNLMPTDCACWSAYQMEKIRLV